MNIADSIGFKPEKTAVLPLAKSEYLNYFAVGLLKNQALKAHKTAVPAMLTVLKGSLSFQIEGKDIHLACYDTYPIPADIMHAVTGLEEENIFTILKGI